MSNPPKKRAPQTGSTSKKVAAVAAPSISPETAAMLDILLQKMARLAAQQEHLKATDARLVWDVQLMDGNGNLIANAVGSTDLPGLLEGVNMKGAVDTVGIDIRSKMQSPLLGQLQGYVNDYNKKRNLELNGPPKLMDNEFAGSVDLDKDETLHINAG